MKILPLQSSMLVGLGYNINARLLIVQFDADTYYAYDGVDPETVVHILFSDSHGAEFTRRVKNANFPYQRITKEEAFA